jgi:transposase
VIRRKAEVVSAVRGGMMSVTEALERYQISEEEFESWIWAFDRHGLRGLRTTLRGERC